MIKSNEYMIKVNPYGLKHKNGKKIYWYSNDNNTWISSNGKNKVYGVSFNKNVLIYLTIKDL